MWRWVRDRKRKAWMVLDSGKPAGMVRCEYERHPTDCPFKSAVAREWMGWPATDPYEVETSVVLFPAFRGRGLASWAIGEAAQIAAYKMCAPVTAYIRKGNRASMGAFRKAGFRFTGRVIDGLSQFVYGEDL